MPAIDPPSIAEELSRWFSRLDEEDLPDDVAAATKLRLLDFLGVVLVGARTPMGAAVGTVARSLGRADESRLIGRAEPMPASAAALANGALAQALEFDDTHNETIIHVSSPVAAAALAVAEAQGSSGRELLCTLAGASEITCRIGLAAPGQFHARGFHSTGVMGAFGAAFAAARALGLAEEKMTHAAGIVGSQASGILECWADGTWAKFLHPGWSAHAGVIAAQLAGAGFTGPSRVLEGRFGFFRSHLHGLDFDFGRTVDGLGADWESRNISFKPFPSAHVLHSFVDAILHLYEHEGLRADAVESIVCPIAAYMVPIVCEPEAEKLRPRTPEHARVSLPYTIAEALRYGRLDAESYKESGIRDPALLELAGKIRYRIDETAPGREQYKGWVVVRTTDGRRLERVEPFNRGSRQRPMDAADIIRKFRSNARGMLSDGAADQVVARVMDLESLPNLRDVTALCAGMAPG